MGSYLFLLKSLFKTLCKRVGSLGHLADISTPYCGSFLWPSTMPLPMGADVTGLRCGPLLRWIKLQMMLLRGDFQKFPTLVPLPSFSLITKHLYPRCSQVEMNKKGNLSRGKKLQRVGCRMSPRHF